MLPTSSVLIASPQTSFGVRLSRIEKKMNAWQTNPKGRLRGGYCSHIGKVSQALAAAMSQAHRRHMRTRLEQNYHFYNLKQTHGSSGMTGPPCISNCIFLHKVKLSVSCTIQFYSRVSSAWWPLGGDSKRRAFLTGWPKGGPGHFVGI